MPADLAPSKPRMAARERVFAVLAVIFFLLAVALLAAFLYLYFTTRQDEVCMTSGCIRTGSCFFFLLPGTRGLWLKDRAAIARRLNLMGNEVTRKDLRDVIEKRHEKILGEVSHFLKNCC